MPPDLHKSAPTEKSKAAKEAKAKASFEEMKSNVATLAELANSLKDDLSKANPNQLPPALTEKVEQIDKLARRIRKVSSNF